MNETYWEKPWISWYFIINIDMDEEKIKLLSCDTEDISNKLIKEDWQIRVFNIIHWIGKFRRA